MTNIIPFAALTEFNKVMCEHRFLEWRAEEASIWPQKASVVYRLMGEYLLIKWIWM